MNAHQHQQEIPVIPSEELGVDAHAAFRRIRRSHPLVLLETGEYVVLRNDHVVELGSDERLQATGTGIPQSLGISSGPLYKIFEDGMLTANGEIHARRRLPISKALAGELLVALRQHARQAAERLIAKFASDRHADLGAQFADLVPTYTLASLFGLPEDDLLQFSHDVSDMNRFLHFGPEAVKASENAATRVREHLEVAIAARHLAPQDDFLSRCMVLAGGAELSLDEAVAQIIQFIMGGTESVRTAIVAQIAILMSSPDYWTALVKDHDVVPAVIAEALRLEPGIAGSVRIAVEDIGLDSWTVPAGSIVILSAMSAMRDEAVFEEPNVFNPSREDAQAVHLAFGVGAHRCVAERFAMAEIEESLIALATALPSLKLINQPEFTGHVFIRNASACFASW